MSNKQNISLLVGLAIPICMIIFVAIAINSPRWFSSIEPPQHNFLYMLGQVDPNVTYLVKNGRLTRNETATAESRNKPAQQTLHFFIHDVNTNHSREIKEEDAMVLQLDDSLRSADGFALESGGRRGWFLFGYSRNYRDRYLVKENYSQKLNLETQDGNYRYYWNIRFIGWLNADG